MIGCQTLCAQEAGAEREAPLGVFRWFIEWAFTVCALARFLNRVRQAGPIGKRHEVNERADCNVRHRDHGSARGETQLAIVSQLFVVKVSHRIVAARTAVGRAFRDVRNEVRKAPVVPAQVAAGIVGTIVISVHVLDELFGRSEIHRAVLGRTRGRVGSSLAKWQAERVEFAQVGNRQPGGGQVGIRQPGAVRFRVIDRRSIRIDVQLIDGGCRHSEWVPTMATDGVSLFYNPEFVETLNAATLAGTLAHEVMHPALHHHVRRSGRDPKRWNVAWDFAINPLLVDAGLSLPDGVLIDNRFRGMSAKQIYNLLESETEQDSGKEDQADGSGGEDSTEEESGDGDSNSPSAPITDGGIGQVLDASPKDGETSTSEEQAREWDVAVNQATAVAKQAGKVPAGLSRTLDGAAEAAVNWRELLRRLWSDTAPADYSWMRPNRRHVWAGLYLPGVVREGVGEIAIAVDCSGSVNARQLRLFEAEVCSILEGQRPARVHVLYFDSEVQKVETYVAGQPVRLCGQFDGQRLATQQPAPRRCAFLKS